MGAILASASHGSINRAGTSCVKIQCHSKPGLSHLSTTKEKKRETTGVGYTRAEAQARQPVGYGVKKIDTGLEKSDD